MIKYGYIRHYHKARQMLEAGGFSVSEQGGELVRKLIVNGEVALSIAKYDGGLWIFNYNSEHFAEERFIPVEARKER